MSSDNQEENKPEIPVKKDPFMYIPLGNKLKSLAPRGNDSDMTLYKALK